MKLTLLHRIKLCCEILTTRSGHGRSSHEKQLSVFQRGYDAGFRDVRLKHDYIEKMARENKVYVEGEDIYKEYRCGERVLKQFAEAYAAKVLEDKEREIAELKAQINGLREALVGIIDNDGGDGSKCFDAQILHSSRMKAIKLLSKTPAQNLQSFENEVIEMVASAWTCDCDDCPDNIRALKATND